MRMKSPCPALPAVGRPPARYTVVFKLKTVNFEALDFGITLADILPTLTGSMD